MQANWTATQLRMSGERYEAWRANLIYQSTMMQHIATTASYWSGDKYWNKGYALRYGSLLFRSSKRDIWYS
jgi:hypothetical protein